MIRALLRVDIGLVDGDADAFRDVVEVVTDDLAALGRVLEAAHAAPVVEAQASWRVERQHGAAILVARALPLAAEEQLGADLPVGHEVCSEEVLLDQRRVGQRAPDRVARRPDGHADGGRVRHEWAPFVAGSLERTWQHDERSACTNATEPRPKLGPAPGVLTRFAGVENGRFHPSAGIEPFVEHYWWVRWDVARPRVTEVLSYPSVHVVFESGAARV